MLYFSELATQVRTLWAKSGESGGHGLLAHMLDVAATTESLLALEPPSTMLWVSGQLGMLPDEALRWLACMVGLHDFGKAIPGFQAKWPQGMRADEQAGFQFPASACRVDRHSCATAALLGRPLFGIWPLAGGWLSTSVRAVSAHHGWHFLQQEINSSTPLREPASWEQARQSLLDTYFSVLAPVRHPSVDTLSFAFINWLAGLTSAVDWIASNPEWFPLGERKDDLGAYFQYSHELARLALKEIGWSDFQPLLADDQSLDRLLERITGRKNISPRPLQIVGDQLLQQSRGSSLLIIEAPMGEGKTELAFLAALRLQRQNQHRGVYVAMPTQATGNAMFERTLKFLEAFAERHIDVQLAHGGAFLNDDLAHLRLVDIQRTQGVDDSAAESLSASAWFGQRRRPLLSPYGVGTVDQALYAALPVKHHFVRLWGLANRVVIFDEVHAYDTYTSDLIVTLLRWLRELGSSVILMSATLPARRKREFLAAWCDNNQVEVPVRSYPCVTLADESGIQSREFEAQRSFSLYLASVPEDLEAIAVEGLSLLQDGGCGAIIVNTVDRAQALYQILSERCFGQVTLMLFHARFPASQRVSIEQQVLNLFGVNGQRPQQALLVATQVVEQSLDLDFDFMFSDLAPIDLLLQRAGRLHRHARARPKQHEFVCLRVAGLVRDRLPELKETKWMYVYDPLILLRTWEFLKEQPVLQLPLDIDRYVQSVYDMAESLPDDWNLLLSERAEDKLLGEHLGELQYQRQLAKNVALDPREDPASAYADRLQGHEAGQGRGIEAKTRLGPESVTLIPLWETLAGWRIGQDGQCFDSSTVLGDDVARMLYARQIKVSRRELVESFREQEAPACFVEHPWLRDMYPLLLREGSCIVSGLRVCFDEKLGLIYDLSPSHPH
ncbi:CRISPR-associated helicase/endonuclease Cas3 [Candidimonas nitroreducens]|uniref:CRISPR-associated helicase/endonuclease Cas3 n=1 Tax=Candidimonas nitroreducens TaxID=683354 RepID=A0A225MIM2_9BURK|nr:CRISPR-associated helicase/endonuclease Cas3 [Candidimonas nitroreducens]OWT60153.1 CRISPR-associated helicase/endonuclease Cas3 [Candidimonas nitroreducens]